MITSTPFIIDIKTLVFFIGMVILSFLFYRLSDRLKSNRSWTQYFAGLLLLVYTALGGMLGFLWPALAGVLLTFICYYPLHFLWLVIVDAVQKNKYEVFDISDEDFRKLDVDSQISLWRMRIRYYRKEVIRMQSARGLAVMAFIVSLLIFISGLLVLSKLQYIDLLILLVNLMLFMLLFNITPRTRGLFFNFLGKYVFSPEIIKLNNNYEQELQQCHNEIRAIEQGYYMTTKKQIMNRLRF